MTRPPEREQDKDSRHVSSFDLEAMRLEALPDADRAWVSDHVRHCARCADLARDVGSSRERFTRSVLPRLRAAAAARRARRAWWQRPWLGALLVPVAAVIVLLVAPPKPAPPSPPAAGDPDIGIQGGPGLMVVARREARVFPVDVSQPLRAGDQLRFVLQQPPYPFVLIASIDGAGQATVYVPYGGGESARFEPAPRIEVPGSIVIDASPGPERLFALYSRRPIPAAAVRVALARIGAGGADAIRRTEHLQVGADAQSTVLMEKDNR